MQKTVLKFGLLSAGLIVLAFSTSYSFMSDLSMQMQEILGYLSMFIALLFVFFGIRSYRDKEAGGYISFGRALGLGILISLIPATVFGIFDVIYIKYINPDFFEQYYQATISELGKTLSGEALQAKMAEMQQMKEMASGALFNFLLMFVTVLLLGFIISLISALALRRNPKSN